MTHKITLNVKCSNAQLNKSKSGMNNSTQVSLNLSSNVISDSNEAFPNKPSANVKLSKSKILNGTVRRISC